MHWISRHMLKELAVADSRTYSDLIPPDVEGNSFQYHARSLERDGLIERSKAGYMLTAAGKDLVGSMSLTRVMRRAEQPQPVVMIYAQNETGETLLFRWRRQPYRGLVSLPFGRVLRGRGMLEMAAEQLRDKTGYTAQLECIGVVSLRATGYELVATVIRASGLVPTNAPDSLTGEAYWGNFDAVSRNDGLAGQSEIIAWITNPARSSLLELNLTKDTTTGR